jgi:hypothetical protein
MTKSAAIAIAASLLISSTTASGHEGHNYKKLMGTVKTIDATRIELALKDGHQQSIPLSKHIKIMRGKESVGIDQVKPGARVIVMLGEDDKTAGTIKLGVPPRK